MNLAQNVCLHEFQIKFEIGSLWVKNFDHRAKSAENHVNTSSHIFLAIIMNLVRSVCLDNF